MAKKKLFGKRHNLQDATEPLDDFNRLARKRLGLPTPEKIVNSSRRRRLPLLLLLAGVVACLIGYGHHFSRRQAVVVPHRKLLTVSFLEVGQGDSTLIQTPSGKNILIDTGPPAESDALLNELGHRNVQRLDMLITSHPDQDHYGNTIAVLRRYQTTTVVDSGFVKSSSFQLQLLQEIKRQNIPFVNVLTQKLAGTSRDLGDGVILSYLAPKVPFADANNNSIILKVSLGRTSFLFMGDAEYDERAWLLSSGQNIQANILKVAHHGSRNGTDDAFLARVHPEVAVISCGIFNRYNHPAPEALDALRRANVNVWRTDLQGTINVETDGKTYQIAREAK